MQPSAKTLPSPFFLAESLQHHNLSAWPLDEVNERLSESAKLRTNISKHANKTLKELGLHGHIEHSWIFTTDTLNAAVAALELKYDSTQVDEDAILEACRLIRKPLDDLCKAMDLAHRTLGENIYHARITRGNHIHIDESSNTIVIPEDALKLLLKTQNNDSTTLDLSIPDGTRCRLEIPPTPPSYSDIENPEKTHRAYVGGVIDSKMLCIILRENKSELNLSFGPEHRLTLLNAQTNNLPVSINYTPTVTHRNGQPEHKGGTLLEVSIDDTPPKYMQGSLFDDN